VALHRAVHLAKSDPQARILLTTFSNALANALKKKLASLVSSDPAVSARITVKAIGTMGHDLFAEHFGEPQLASPGLIKNLIEQAAAKTQGHKFSTHFLLGEWADIVDAWQLKTWEA
jgi:superfamily I DNA/RNA helicase